MNELCLNGIDLDIICSMINTPGLGLLRSIDEGLTYMNETAMTLFELNAIEEVCSCPWQNLFADSEMYPLVNAKQDIAG